MWKDSPIGHLQPLPQDGKPISASRSRGAKLLEVANGIRTVIEQKFSISVVSPLSLPQSSLSLGEFITPLERVRELATNCMDRKDTLEQLRTDFKNRNKHLFIIGGFDGMGKTTLAVRFATDLSEEYNVLWINCEVISVAVDSFLREIGRIASNQYKRFSLSVILDNPTVSSDEKEDELLAFLAYVSHLDHEEKSHASLKPIVLFLDGYHKVEDPVLNQLILKIASSKVGTKMVLTLRQMPPDFRLAKGLVTEIDLSGLSEASCRQLMECYPALENLIMQEPATVYLGDETFSPA